MNRFFVLFVVNFLVVALGGFLAYSDLNLRQYDTREHLNTTVVDVEYAPLLYRPIYEYHDIRPQEIMISHGSWTVDFLQLAILVMAIVDLSWIYLRYKKKTDGPVNFGLKSLLNYSMVLR